jgi:hypothetical protein
MATQIPDNHPLRTLFQDLVRFHFYGDAHLPDAEVTRYVSEILVGFTHADNLFQIRNARGRQLKEVAEMLVESDPLRDARSFDREREVRKHIGDFTLFFMGLFPEHLRSRAGLRKLRVDCFLDYVKTGKESYAIVSSFNLFEYREEAPLFRRLSDCFEQCVYGLSLVKGDLERMQGGYYRRLQKALD